MTMRTSSNVKSNVLNKSKQQKRRNKNSFLLHFSFYYFSIRINWASWFHTIVLYWFPASAAAVIDRTIAHEAGHVVGLEDEYPPGSPPYSSWPNHIMNGYLQPGSYTNEGYNPNTYVPALPGEFRVKP